jgi:hypothetical protein
MTWVWIVAAWVLLAVAAALLIGRSIHAADRRRRNFVVDEAGTPEPRVPQPVELDALGLEPQRRSTPRSFVQNCVPATERTPAPQPPVPRPRS